MMSGIARIGRFIGKEYILAVDSFAHIDGIEGESTDDRHQGWIEIMAYQTELNQPVSSTKSSAGGATAGRADFGDYSFLKMIDKSSPLLALACAEGRHFDSIVIELCRAGGEKLTYFEYKLSNCLITGVDYGGGRGEVPAEIIYIAYGKIEWRYVKQIRSGGGAAGQIAAGWNLEKNCRI
jgi:type VI secretion system secreted protein Hcp